MNDLLAKLAAENKALRESAEAKLVVESVIAPAGSIQKVEFTESDGSKTKGYRLAKVAQADRMNQNHRVYPRKEWEAQVQAANEDLIPSGRLIGAVDHASWMDGGNLKDSPILWKKLELKADGAVEGEFVVIANHSRGADLQAQLDAGMAIGFSTVGYAKGREPTADERKLYGIAENDEDAVILEFYRLKKIDAVDDPSVIDAWIKKEQPAAARTEESAIGGAELNAERAMKTLAELKEKAPELFVLHEQAIAQAVAAKEADLLKQIEGLKTEAEGVKTQLGEAQNQLKALEGIRGFLGEVTVKLGKEHGVAVPFREVSEKEAAEKIETLTKAAEAKDNEIASLKAVAEQAQKEAAQREAAAKEAQRVADVKAKLAELLKDNRFAEQIKKAVEAAIPDKAFDVKAAESLVKAKTEEYEAVVKTPAPAFGITGITSFNDDNTQGAGESDDEPLPIAKEMAEAL